MSETKPKSQWEDPRNLLTIMQIVALGVTLIWVFAFMRADVNNNTKGIEKNSIRLESHSDMLRSQEIKQAVTNEQYKQIIDKIDELSKKLDSRE